MHSLTVEPIVPRMGLDEIMRLRTAVDIGSVLKPVQGGLMRVEEKMRSVESSLFAPLARAFVGLIGSGGKRLRPALALMAAQVYGEIAAHPETAHEYEQVVALSASVEMLHTATLVHDDVIDGALLRRGAPTLNALWNRSATVLAGNYMFARAASFAAETGNMRVIRIFSDTLETIVNGELRQLFARRNFVQEKSDYYDRIYAKTASLFCAATEAAAVLAKLPEADVRALRDYGYHLGMAFQIVDDILDFTGNESSLGKPAGSDMLQGTLTLPFFYYLQAHPQPDTLVQRLTLAAEEADDGDSTAWREAAAEIVAAVRAGPAVEEARQEAEMFLERARACLTDLPESVYKCSLLDLCDFVVQRTY